MTDTSTEFKYPYNPEGNLPECIIENELATITYADENYIFVVPRQSPFFKEDLIIHSETLDRNLVIEEDYILSHKFAGASKQLEKDIYGSITLIGVGRRDILHLTYSTLGGDYTYRDQDALRSLTGIMTGQRYVNWDDIVDPPHRFPPVEHIHDADDIQDMDDVVDALDRISDLISGETHPSHRHTMDKIDGLVEALAKCVSNDKNIFYDTLDPVPIKDFGKIIAITMPASSISVCSVTEIIINDGVKSNRLLAFGEIEDGKGVGGDWKYIRVISDNDNFLNRVSGSYSETGNPILYLESKASAWPDCTLTIVKTVYSDYEDEFLTGIYSVQTATTLVGNIKSKDLICYIRNLDPILEDIETIGDLINALDDRVEQNEKDIAAINRDLIFREVMILEQDYDTNLTLYILLSEYEGAGFTGRIITTRVTSGNTPFAIYDIQTVKSNNEDVGCYLLDVLTSESKRVSLKRVEYKDTEYIAIVSEDYPQWNSPTRGIYYNATTNKFVPIITNSSDPDIGEESDLPDSTRKKYRDHYGLNYQYVPKLLATESQGPEANSLTRKDWVDGNKVDKAGSTMTGDLNIKAHLTSLTKELSGGEDLDFNDFIETGSYGIANILDSINPPPVGHCTLDVISNPSRYVTQVATERLTNRRCFRTGHKLGSADRVWSDWVFIYSEVNKPTKSDVGLGNVDDVKQFPILKTLTNEDLDDITEDGLYTQRLNSNAKPELNYPIENAGKLLVYAGEGSTDQVTQFYISIYNDIYTRSYYNSWRAWDVIFNVKNKPTKTDVGLGNVDDIKQVPSIRKINTTAPLVGGNDLSEDRTFSIDRATTTVPGTVQLTESLTSTSKTEAPTADALRRVNESSDSGLKAHLDDKSNPHVVTKTQVGLGSVDDVKQLPLAGGVATDNISIDKGNDYTYFEVRRGDIAARYSNGLSTAGINFLRDGEEVSFLSLGDNLRVREKDDEALGRVYSTNYKPTKSDVGLSNVDNVKQVPLAGGTMTGGLVVNEGGVYPKDTAKDADELRGEYPDGISMCDVSSNDGYPGSYQSLITFNIATHRVLQLLAEKYNKGLYYRAAGDDGDLGEFIKIYSDDYKPIADKWTTGRKITFTGDATGSLTIDGSADVSAAIETGSLNGINTNRFVYGDTANGTIGHNDFDTVPKSGFYRSSKAENGPVDDPTGGWFWYLNVAHSVNDFYNFQLATENSSTASRIWFRSTNSSGEGDWTELYSRRRRPSKSDVGLSNVDDVKQLPLTGGTLRHLNNYFDIYRYDESTHGDPDFEDGYIRTYISFTRQEGKCTWYMEVRSNELGSDTPRRDIDLNLNGNYVYHNGRKPTKSDVGLSNVDNVKQAPSTRKINTTAPLSGGGDLSADRTLKVADATTSAKGVSQLNDATNSTSTAQAATANAAKKAYDRGSSGITKADAAQAAVDTHVAKTDNPHSVTKSQVGLSNVDNVKQAAQSIQIIAGTNCTGGGTLEGNRTINVPNASTTARGAVQLNTSTSSTSTTEAATASAVKAVNDQISQVTPIGACMMWPGSSAPNGWAEARGQSTSSMSQAIKDLYGNNLPDMRGQFARGWDNDRGVDSGRSRLSTQDEATKAHNHSASFKGTAVGGHTHTRGSMNIKGQITGSNNMTLGTGANGAFSRLNNGRQHSFGSGTVNGGVDFDASKNWSGSTSSEGGHTPAGSVTVSNSSGSETRPRNTAWMYIIYIG